MRKLTMFVLFVLIAAFAFAQSVYTVDLNKLPAVNEVKTATFDKATKTVTVTANEKLQYGGDKGVYLWLDRMDISGYNIARVKYKVIGDYGFHFVLDYDDDKLDWDRDKSTYCPSYLNEMVIPLIPNQKKLRGISFAGTWNVPYEQFVIESVTLEKVSNPTKTDIYASNEPAVIDKATSGNFDDKISAWDYVKKLGVGFQYYPFATCEAKLDFGMDCFHPWRFKKPSKEIIHFIKEKGFKTIRLQTSPEAGHLLDENCTIDPRYIKALKEVVDWIIEEDMYVIICGPFSEFLQNNPAFKKRIDDKDVHYGFVDVSEENKNQTEKLIQAIWKQYAAAFNNSYDEHLIFETLNEPTHNFHEHDLPREDCNVCKKDYAIMNEYNQLIVDTIRASGGNNAKRFILIEGIGFARWQCITTNLFKLPSDKIKDRLIPTIHSYPMGGNMQGLKKYYTSNVKAVVSESFAALDKVYFKKHIPVYVSEVGHIREIPILDRINAIKDFMSEVTKEGRSCSALLHLDPMENDMFGYYNSFSLKWFDTEYINTFIYGAQGKEYPLSAEFLKNNETKIESIVGKNLITEPFDTKKWGSNYEIKSDTFVRSVPESYKLEFVIKKTGSSPTIQITWEDENYQWHKIPGTAKKIKGGSLADGNVRPSKTTFTVEIDSETAKTIEDSNGLYLMGQDVIIQSMTVVE